jgi:hypothetical protein
MYSLYCTRQSRCTVYSGVAREAKKMFEKIIEKILKYMPLVIAIELAAILYILQSWSKSILWG